ncbi:MAG: hypothetical protein P4M11_11270 [Candidatus Pacebacteria bacterium]|nr:hypothetical protein [Candidatus Paceibacterota bacterium]
MLFSGIDWSEEYVEQVIKEAAELMERAEPERILLQANEKLMEESPILNYKMRVDKQYDKEEYFVPWERRNKSKIFMRKYYKNYLNLG